MAMIPAIRVIFAAFTGEIVAAVTQLDWDDHISAVQTVVQTPDEIRHQLPRAGIQLEAVRHRPEEHIVDTAACPMHTVLYNYNVSFSYQVKRDWVDVVYTMEPMGLSGGEGGAGAAWEALDRISFAFPDCTCRNPDLFSRLAMAEYTSSNAEVGQRIRFTEVCGADSRTVVFEDIRGELAKDTYRLRFTLMSHTFGVGAVQIRLIAGSHEGSARICGTICNPGDTATTLPPETTSFTVRAENDSPGRTTTRRPGPAAQSVQSAPATGANPVSAVPEQQASPASAATTVSPLAQGAEPLPESTPQGAAAGSPATDAATTFGDPHVGNLKGEKFNIINPDNYTFLVIPRGSDEQSARLHLVGRVERPGPVCNELLFITGLTFRGLWLGRARQLELTTRVDAGMDVRDALRIRMGGSLDELNFSGVQEFAPSGLVEVTEFHPEPPQALYQHVTTLLLRLRLGPCTSKVRVVYQKEKDGYSNSLWLTTSGLRHVEENIGGILGLDDHEVATTIAEECERQRGDIAPAELGGSMHAVAELEDEAVGVADM